MKFEMIVSLHVSPAQHGDPALRVLRSHVDPNRRTFFRYYRVPSSAHAYLAILPWCLSDQAVTPKELRATRSHFLALTKDANRITREEFLAISCGCLVVCVFQSLDCDFLLSGFSAPLFVFFYFLWSRRPPVHRAGVFSSMRIFVLHPSSSEHDSEAERISRPHAPLALCSLLV